MSVISKEGFPSLGGRFDSFSPRKKRGPRGSAHKDLGGKIAM